MFKKEKRSWMILFCIILVPIFCIVIVPLMLYSIGCFLFTTEKMYEINWNITLPDDMDLLDDKKTESFRGDGIRHTVYSVHDAEKYFFDFKTANNDEIEKICSNMIAGLQVEEIYAPDFTTEYMWKKYTRDNNILIVVYILDKEQLHMFQQLI